MTESYSDGLFIYAEDGGAHHQVARVNTWGVGAGRANAHLMAAAPELLEALCVIRIEMGNHYDDRAHWTPAQFEVLDRIAEAAISKARAIS